MTRLSPQHKCGTLWPIFQGPVNISWRLFDVWTSLFGIMSQYDPTLFLKINVGHCDLYFLVQWFCLISWRLFDVWTSHFGIMGQCGPTFDLKINVGHCDLYFMVQWFCLISWRPFDIWTSSVWPDIWPQNKCRSLWPMFHGPVILCYILKTIWCMNIVLWDYGWVWPDVWPQNKCRSLWPIFHGLVMLFNILKTISWRNVILGMMDKSNTKIDLIKYMCVSDLYFVVQWFCLIYVRLVHEWVAYLGCSISMT